ncbi:tetratricopeptide repeat protein [Streptomyces sp. NPDC059165]|uniref:tetratricopeptide repeat protein n=1 Tax=Streptomyces sp. NPDC059165 TaxID=3346751 RepID=UPI0036B783F5
MKTRYAPNVRNAVVASLVVGALGTGIMVFGPGGEDGPAPAPGPAGQAMLAAGVGASRSLGEVSALIRSHEKWVGAHPDDSGAWAVLGLAYTQRGVLLGDPTSYPKAETALKRSLEALPGEKGNADAQLGMAVLANVRRDYAAAKRWAESVRARTPKQWTTYPVLIDAYSGLGQYAGAEKAMAKLSALRPGLPQTLLRSSQVAQVQGQREDAIATADEASTRSATTAEKTVAMHRLGELAWERGEPGEAAGYYDAALRLDPRHHPSLAGRARARAALGRTNEALRDYQAAVQRLPLPRYALQAGELYESLGQRTEALAQYGAVRTLAARARKSGANEELVLAAYEADHASARSAVTRLGRQWRQLRRNTEVSDTLGWALFRAGRTKEGLKYAKRATATGEQNALYWYHRGEIERSLGDDGPARRHLAQALRINPYFSPLLVKRAKAALKELGDPPPGGPRDVEGEPWDDSVIPDDDGDYPEDEESPAQSPGPRESRSPAESDQPRDVRPSGARRDADGTSPEPTRVGAAPHPSEGG